MVTEMLPLRVHVGRDVVGRGEGYGKLGWRELWGRIMSLSHCWQSMPLPAAVLRCARCTRRETLLSSTLVSVGTQWQGGFALWQPSDSHLYHAVRRSESQPGLIGFSGRSSPRVPRTIPVAGDPAGASCL